MLGWALCSIQAPKHWNSLGESLACVGKPLTTGVQDPPSGPRVPWRTRVAQLSPALGCNDPTLYVARTLPCISVRMLSTMLASLTTPPTAPVGGAGARWRGGRMM